MGEPLKSLIAPQRLCERLKPIFIRFGVIELVVYLTQFDGVCVRRARRGREVRKLCPHAARLTARLLLICACVWADAKPQRKTTIDV